MLPDFAKPIVDARRSGRRPANVVIVSDGDHGLHAKFPDNPVVRVRREAHERPSLLDWRFLAGLDVEIATTAHDAYVVALATAIDRARPLNLRIWHLPSNSVIRVRFYGLKMICRETLQ